jgi:hypothetical protein
MKLTCRKVISHTLFVLILILFAVSISIYTILYGTASNNNGTESILTTIDDPVYETARESDHNKLRDNLEYQIISTNKTDSNNKIFSLFFYNAIPIYFQISLVVVLLIKFSSLFLLLPDDWTLINLMVRLND